MTPVTEVEQNAYYDFVASMAPTFVPQELLQPGELLWHYTNGNALLKILESKSLLATQVACLNDSDEIMYASHLLADAIKEVAASATEPEAKFLNGYFATDLDYSTPLAHFVTCFSRKKDDISQWQAYCSGTENGYAIGCDPVGLKGMGDGLVAVNYEREVHDAAAKKVAEATLRFYQEGLELRPGESAEEWGAAFGQVWDEQITHLAPLLKDKCWAHEKEYRIIRLYRGDVDLENVVIFQKDTMMTRHLRLHFIALQGKPEVLPIREIMIGPCRHPKTSAIAIGLALRKYGYTTPIPVTISERRLRKT
jgi:hypothetical protein